MTMTDESEALPKSDRLVGPVANPQAQGRSALRILIVDDNRDSATTLSTLLRQLGHQTLTAFDGEEAVSKARSFSPDVVLLDIGLPKLNGYEVCRWIRAQGSSRSIVIIAQTGWGQDETRQKTSDAGFDHHMVKPLDPSALVKILNDLTKQKFP
jgi:CheY-like chemotaxis protein